MGKTRLLGETGLFGRVEATLGLILLVLVNGAVSQGGPSRRSVKEVTQGGQTAVSPDVHSGVRIAGKTARLLSGDPARSAKIVNTCVNLRTLYMYMPGSILRIQGHEKELTRAMVGKALTLFAPPGLWSGLWVVAWLF